MVCLMSLGEGQKLFAEAAQQDFTLGAVLDRKVDEGLEGGETAQEKDASLHFVEKALDLSGLHAHLGFEAILDCVIQKVKGLHCAEPSHNRYRYNPEQAEGDHQLGPDGKPAEEFVNIDHLVDSYISNPE
jgi:hypothetical protein